MRRFSRIRPDEAGFTLIELLISMVVIAVGVFAVLGALRLGIVSGEGQRTMSVGETTLRSFAEHVKAEEYQPCATPASYGALFAALYEEKTPVVEVAEVRYWDGDLEGSEVEFGETCPGDDQGLQELRLLVEAEFGDVLFETLLVKRASP